MKVINPKYITVKGSEATLLLTFVKIRIFGPFSEKRRISRGKFMFSKIFKRLIEKRRILEIPVD